MLRFISTCNFVHFEEPQILKFDEPINFIIGGNSTGKSAIFELIRRCYSKKQLPNKDKLAYIVCNFEITEDYPLLQIGKENPYRVVSFVFANQKGNNSTTNMQNKYWYKGVSLIYKTKNSLFTYVYFEHTKTYRELKFEELQVKDIATHFSDINKIEKDVQGFFDEIINFQEIDLSQENMLTDIYEWLEKGYVGVFPMRSIGPLQWTRSSKFNFSENEVKNNYEEAGKNAEILQELLCNEKITKDLEEKYHKILVYPFTFIKEEGTIMVYNALDDSDRFNILKTPEGILEAKQLTLILAHSEFHTITLEEPDRGMHIHMVKKVRDFILKKVTGKTVIIITHNTAFMDQWSMSRSFVCSRRFNGKAVQHNVSNFPKEYTKYKRLEEEEEEMKNVMFSSRILFVEGITDKIIMQAVFRLLINIGDNIAENPEENQKLRDYLLSIDIHNLHSATKGNDKSQLCKELLKEYFILYDSDVFKDKSAKEKRQLDVNKPFKINGKVKDVDYMESFENKAEFLKEENVSKFALKCEMKNIFVWKDGAIEYQIINLLNNDDTALRNVISKIVYLKSLKQPGYSDNAVLRYIREKDKRLKKQSKQRIRSGLKNNLESADSDDIDTVANALIKSEEGKRLIGFFQRKMNITQPIAMK